MSTAKQREIQSVESYLAQFGQSGIRLEFINGDVRSMTAPTIRHNIIATNVLVTLGMKLKGSKCREFNSNSLVRIRHETGTWLYFPDVSVVCESNSQSEIFQDQPTLVAEVLSPSTRSIDLDEKVEKYLSIAALEAYLVLEQDKPYAILYQRTPDGFRRESIDGIGRSIRLPLINITLSIADIYEGVQFPPPIVHEPEAAYFSQKAIISDQTPSSPDSR